MKKLLSLLSIALVCILGYTSASAAGTDDFVLTVDTTNSGVSDNDQFQFTGALGDYDVVAKQGESTIQTFNDLSDAATITFTNPGIYDLEVTPKGTNGFNRINFNDGGDKLKLTDIKQWGTIAWSSFDSAFSGCENMLVTATDRPNLSSVTNMRLMFYNASSANPDTSNWDVSNVTSMQRMFESATVANPDTSNWNVSSVTDMYRMFESATSANPDTSNWDVSNVTNMVAMFRYSTSANPDTTNWDVSNVTNMSNMFRDATSANPNTTNWNVSNVTNMVAMFRDSTSANPDVSNWNVSSVTNMYRMFESATVANPDTSNWDVSSVTNMRLMFYNASSANPDTSNWDVSNVTSMSLMFESASSANPDVSSWDVSNVTDMALMFENSALSTTNLTLIYENWSLLTLQQDVSFGAPDAQYNTSGQAGKDIMTDTYNWTITDGGKNFDTTIAFTSPTKSSNRTITDTMITINDDDGILAENVTLDPDSTASALICTQDSPTMVTCTVSIDATGDLIIQTEDASENLETGTETGFVIETKRSSSGSRRVSAKEVKNIFAAARAQEKETEIQETEISKENTNSSAPEENTDTPSPEENTNTSSPEEVLGEGEQCPAPQIITQNMRSGDRNGNFSSWQGSTISEVKILQAHLNR
jgi:surface protein